MCIKPLNPIQRSCAWFPSQPLPLSFVSDAVPECYRPHTNHITRILLATFIFCLSEELHALLLTSASRCSTLARRLSMSLRLAFTLSTSSFVFLTSVRISFRISVWSEVGLRVSSGAHPIPAVRRRVFSRGGSPMKSSFRTTAKLLLVSLLAWLGVGPFCRLHLKLARLNRCTLNYKSACAYLPIVMSENCKRPRISEHYLCPHCGHTLIRSCLRSISACIFRQPRSNGFKLAVAFRQTAVTMTFLRYQSQSPQTTTYQRHCKKVNYSEFWYLSRIFHSLFYKLSSIFILLLIHSVLERENQCATLPGAIGPSLLCAVVFSASYGTRRR